MTAAKSISRAASKGKKARRRRGGKSSATAAATHKNLGFIGARWRRAWGQWAAELRLPCTRERLRIGTFETPLEAAIAYDAAIFCFYGPHIPKLRKINFPTAPSPDIPEHVRVRLTVENIKEIAEKHAVSLKNFLPPPPELPAAVGASIGGCAASATDSGNMSDEGEYYLTLADYLLWFHPEEFDEIMDFFWSIDCSIQA